LVWVAIALVGAAGIYYAARAFGFITWDLLWLK